MDHNAINDKSGKLLDRLEGRLSERRMGNCRSTRFGGEWGFLVNTLAGGVVNERLALTPDERDLLRDLLYQFPVPTRLGLRYIDDREAVLASVEITGSGGEQAGG
jgi:hypothetical protein